MLERESNVTVFLVSLDVWRLGIPKWFFRLVASLTILHLAMAVLFYLPGQLAPRLCMPIIRAIFHLLRKMSEACCLSKWKSDIHSALDEQMKVSV